MRALPVVVLLASFAVSRAESAPPSDEQFAASFRCPESYPSGADREQATKDFLDWARARHGDWTMDQVIAFRVRLLEQHHCEQTLANIRAYGKQERK